MKTLLDRAVRSDVQERVRRLVAGDEALWGVMSVGEMVEHVDQSFAMAIGLRAVAPVAYGGAGKRGLLKLAALRVPRPWPRGVATVPELRREVLGVPPEDFCAAQRALERSVGEFVEPDVAGRRHPIFGAMSRWDWMRWGYLHTDHHLRQFGR